MTDINEIDKAIKLLKDLPDYLTELETDSVSLGACKYLAKVDSKRLMHSLVMYKCALELEDKG